ncbi:Transcriptional regulator, LysR family [Paraburkholderia ribeironis]|uniref:Transcriptional regulator, LysR family n=2 Tax=Paraburkholderia ribeironis TaxID=1247936 RepID=A0A1N7RKH7_9BURK|nr:LysR family transcriptional regulator [Paraburkholderia ribeironis]SIT35599.1 Transcriptional regulator, LysR family [Paraburkholderia ribeironis]
MQRRMPLFADRLLVQMPSLRALRCFVTAARYGNFTQAAEVLCVTQAAISRQIKELEDSLDVVLFERSGRRIALTEAGTILYNASYLSIMNIAESIEALRRHGRTKLIICVSHAFSMLWLAPRLAAFQGQFPDIRLHVVVTDHYVESDGIIDPDVIVTKNPPREAEYKVEQLFHDIVYPVCSEQFFQQNLRGKRLTALGLLNYPTLNLSPVGRTHLGEHVDWRVWRNWFQQGGDVMERLIENECLVSNDYQLLVSQAEAGEGMVLGWHHLVHRQIEKGVLVRPIEESLVFRDRHHYLITHKNALKRPDYEIFREWMVGEVEKMLSGWCESDEVR